MTSGFARVYVINGSTPPAELLRPTNDIIIINFACSRLSYYSLPETSLHLSRLVYAFVVIAQQVFFFFFFFACGALAASICVGIVIPFSSLSICII